MPIMKLLHVNISLLAKGREGVDIIETGLLGL